MSCLAFKFLNFKTNLLFCILVLKKFYKLFNYWFHLILQLLKTNIDIHSQKFTCAEAERNWMQWHYFFVDYAEINFSAIYIWTMSAWILTTFFCDCKIRWNYRIYTALMLDERFLKIIRHNKLLIHKIIFKDYANKRRSFHPILVSFDVKIEKWVFRG